LIKGYAQPKTEIAEQSGSLSNNNLDSKIEGFYDRVFSYFAYFEGLFNSLRHTSNNSLRSEDIKGAVKSLHLFSIMQVL
jgi:hypothetical protein